MVLRGLLRMAVVFIATVVLAMAAFDAYFAVISFGTFLSTESIVASVVLAVGSFLLNAWPELLVFLGMVLLWRALVRRWQTQAGPP